jgi:hypothetical protein
LQTPSDIICMMYGTCSLHGEIINLCNILVGKHRRKRPLRIPWLRWVDNIKIYLKEMWWGNLNWINLYQDKDQWRVLVNTATNLRQQKTEDFLTAARCFWLLKKDSSL